MIDAAVPAAEPDPGARAHLRRLGAGLGHYVRHDLGRLILFSVVGFAVGYLANAVVMAMRYQGYANVPAGAPVVGQGNVAYASLVWALGSGLFFGLLSYRRAVGGKRFWEDVRGFPGAIWFYARLDGDRAFAHLLWGLAGTLLVVQLLSPTLSLLLGAVLVLALTRVLRPIVSGLFMAAYRAIVKSVAPRTQMPPTVAVTVGILGSVGAMAIGMLAPDQVTKLVVAALAIAAAVGLSLLRGRGAPRPATAMLVAGAGVAVLAALRSHLALAHDGGFQECATYHLACGASGLFNQSLFGGTATAVGSGLGAGLGGAGAGLPPDESEEGKLLRHYREWRKLHPGAPQSDFWDWYDQTPDGMRRKLRRALQAAGNWWNLTLGVDPIRFLGNINQDITSGDAWKRIKAMNAQQFQTFLDHLNNDILKPCATAADFWLHPSTQDWSQITDAGKQEIKGAIDFYRSQGLDSIRQGIGELGSMSQDAWAAMQGKMAQLSDAVGRGDDAAVAKILGQLAGDAQFQALMTKGPDLAAAKIGEAADAYKEARAAQAAEDAQAAELAQAARDKAEREAAQEAARAQEAKAGQVTYTNDQWMAMSSDDLLNLPSGTVVPPEMQQMVAEKLGVLQSEHEFFRTRLDETGHVGTVLPGSQEGAAWREAGAVGKPGGGSKGIYSKSATDNSYLMGLGDEGDKSLAVFGQPTEPVRPPGMSDADWAGVQDEYANRQAEYQKLLPAMEKMRDEG
ncbi:MAG TPA: hypothetical protein VG245_04480, partial [Candidatus Dormibacteraeota bacterium]|nr:hypothetical protein [Candidatus Dormibacteraeota bacterium]